MTSSASNYQHTIKESWQSCPISSLQAFVFFFFPLMKAQFIVNIIQNVLNMEMQAAELRGQSTGVISLVGLTWRWIHMNPGGWHLNLSSLAQNLGG